MAHPVPPWDHRDIDTHLDPPATSPRHQPPADGGPWTAGPFGRARHPHGWSPGHSPWRQRPPWRRNGEDRMFGGVAGGLGRRLGVEIGAVRIAFVVFALFGGFGAVAYLLAWLLMPLDGETRSVGARAVGDVQGIVLSLAFVPALVVTLVLAATLHLGPVVPFAWPLFLGASGSVLIWRNCSPEEQAWLRQAVQPVVALGTGSRRSWRQLVLRAVLGILLLVAGLAVLAGDHPQAGTLLRPIAGALLVVVAVVVVFGPWWLRLLRELMAERQARARAEDRADMAARVHDSVLQTLALIQRAADQPQRVVQLARAQERELRSWLFDGDLPGPVGADVATLAAGARRVGEEVEAAHGVPVDVITVGDHPLDDRLRALLAAAREATVNAAKWSGAPMISLFAEAETGGISVYVRDRGRGFDPGAVARDRRGLSESIRGRMLRHGGTALVRSAPGEGTEVELRLPLEVQE